MSAELKSLTRDELDGLFPDLTARAAPHSDEIERLREQIESTSGLLT